MKNIDYKLLTDRVDKRIVSRMNSTTSVFFVLNLLLYVIFTILSVNWIEDTRNIDFNALNAIERTLTFAFLGWGVCILFYGISMVINNPHRTYSVQRQIAEQELGKMAIEAMDGDAWEEKPKRHSVYDSAVEMELSDDGEFVIDEVLEARQVRHKSR